MRSTHWLTYAGALGFLLGSAGQFTLRADEAAEARAIRLIEETGGTVTRDEHAAGKPVIGVSLCGAKLTDDAVKCLSAFPQLRSLDLCRTQGLNWRRIKYLADVKGLESLNMSRCNDIVIGALYHLAALKNLRSPLNLPENLRAMVDRVTRSIQEILTDPPEAVTEDLVNRGVRANIRSCVDQLRHGSPELEKMVQNGRLQIVGGEYSLKTGLVDFLPG